MAVNVVEYALKISDQKAKKALKDTGKEADTASKKTKSFGKQADKSMKDTADSAKETRKEYMALRKDSANLDRLTSELAGALGLVSPELSAAATTASAFAGGLEGVARIFTVVSKKMLFAVGAVGAVAAAYKFLTAASERAAEEQKKLSESGTEALNSLSKLEQQAQKTAEKYQRLQETNQGLVDVGLNVGLKNLVLEGQITKEQEGRIKAQQLTERHGRKIIKQATKQLEIEKEVILNRFQQISDLEKMERIAKAQNRELSKADKARLSTAREQINTAKARRDVLKSELGLLESLTKNPDFEIGSETRTGFFTNLFQSAKDAFFENARINEELRKQAAKQQRIAKARARSLEKARKLTNAINDQFKNLSKVQKITEKINNANTKLDQDAINASAELLNIEAQTLRTIAERTEGNKKTLLIIKAMNLEEQARIKLHNQKNNLIDTEIKKTRDSIKENVKLLATSEKELKALRKKTKNKKERTKIEEELGKIAQKTTDIETKGLAKIAKLEKQQDDNDKQFAAKKKQRLEKESNDNLQRAKTEAKNKEKLRQDENKKRKDEEQKLLDELAKKAEQRRDSIVSAFQNIDQFIGSLTDPGSFLTQITTGIGSLFGGIGGQIGGTIGGIVGAIAQIGQKDPKTLKEEFNNFLMAFEKGLEMLPEILGKLLPQFAFALAKGIILAIPELIRAIIKGLEDFGRNLIESIKNIFSGEDALREGSRKSLKFIADFYGIENDFKSGGRIRSARRGMRVTGGTFGQAQLAMVHPGEIITPQSGSRPQAIDRTLNQMQNGKGVTVVINSAVTESSAIDALVRKIENRFGTFGSSKSTLFG
tara:strand:+ start:8112 stop:10598 length:2487 start_codon:yes stop_codon:yes gene_type:complete